MPVETFRSKAAYERNLAYRHIHGIPMTASRVCIKGRCHKVEHSTNPSRVKIDERQRRKVTARKHESRSRNHSRNHSHEVRRVRRVRGSRKR